MTRTGTGKQRQATLESGRSGRSGARPGRNAARGGKAPKRAAKRGSAAGTQGPRLVGIDYSAAPRPERQGRAALALPLVAGVVCAALLLSALRADIVRTRYALAQALSVEKQLRPQENRLKLRLGQLRSPHRLHRLARELGMDRPAQVLELSAQGARP